MAKKKKRAANKKKLTPRLALNMFLNTIEATGGVVKDGRGYFTPVADPDWVDLGEAYVAACRMLRQKMLVRTYTEEEGE